MRNVESEVLVIGGGVIGCSVAYHLAVRGITVIVAERHDIASGASGACDKAVLLQSKSPGPHLKLAIESALMFPDLVRSIGSDIEYSREGGMVLIEDEDQMAQMEGFVRRQRAAGLEVTMLSPEEAARRQPIISRQLAGATYSPMDGEVNPILLTRAFARAAKSLGAHFLLNSEVKSLIFEGGRVAGACTADTAIHSNYVVNAAGAWAPMIGTMAGINIPIVPRRGQLLVSQRMPKIVYGDMLCARYIVAKLGARSVAGPGRTPLVPPESPEARFPDEATRLGVGLSLGQTASGNILVGACREFAGYDTSNTYDALSAIARHAIRLAPGLRKIDFIRSFAGLRPYTPDGMPIVGPVDGIPGLIMACGHEGDGIALAPITGQIIAEIIDTGESSVSIEPFKYSRFEEGDVVGGHG